MSNNSIEQHLPQIEIFCEIINDFTVTFDQFNAFMLNKFLRKLLKGSVNELMY